jgi:general secretion pathway protein D
MKEKGFNWEFLLSQKGISIGGTLNTFQDVSKSPTSTTTTTPIDFNIGSSTTFNLGAWDGKATTLFKFLENEDLVHTISRPVISAVNGKQGKTQVGRDFSIKEKDFAGNLIDKFYPSGTIIEVTPHVYTSEGTDYMVLKVRMEKSTVEVTAGQTSKPKTEVTTNVLLLNGEETVIGGLITNQATTSRIGIPFLKDLPWWFFGLRYIFGYDKETTEQVETILLIKAEIIPSLRERISRPKDQTVLKNAIENQRKEMEKLNEQSKKKLEDQK